MFEAATPPPPTVWTAVSSPWWPGGHADACGLGLRAASGGGGEQGSLDAGSSCLLGPRSHSGLSSRGSGLGLPRGPESWGAAEADVSVTCRGPLGWTTLSLTPFSFQRWWRPGQVGGGSAQRPPGPTHAWGQGGVQGALRLCSPCWAPALPSGLGGLQEWGSQSPEASAVQDAQLPKASRVQPSVSRDVAWRPQ